MTVEAVWDNKSLFGLRKTEKSKVLEYRSYSIKESDVITLIHSSDLELLNPMQLHKNVEIGQAFNTDLKFVKPISEDSIEIYTWNVRENEQKNRKILVGPQINDENLISDDGETRIRWRDTQPGDYPPIPEGAKVNPIQLNLNMT
ncbi:MAG: hypothetical protein A3B38_01825 [Candidatus Levybacteria bacterium RIFCSPLOWO2_01_FULL_36_13]|nr:MAG: hypothetical protein A2684_03060 [Candidatus Levybacteria bacterium RIFCSPHIGHO2_01_FULL_36_15b]OGH35601.1 MAG: hypothetical protein A3B38_01825 [Candidatus Levybacteria bacterium RIFCSPLOWO2_01_FULL_36_13]